MEKDMKRHYGSMVIYMVITVGLSILPFVYLADRMGENYFMKVYLVYIMWIIWGLAFMIKRNKRLYWINMYSFKRVQAMPDELVTLLCDGFYQIFTRYTLIYTILVIVGYFAGLEVMADTILFMVIAIVMSIHSYIYVAKEEKIYHEEHDSEASEL